MIRILDRYVALELWPPFSISVVVFTFFLVIDRVYQLTDLVIGKQVPVRLVRPFLAAGIIASALIAWLTLVVNPWASAAFQRQIFRILETQATTGIQERAFSSTFGRIVLYVEEVSPSQFALKGLLASDERDPALSRIIVARRGRGAPPARALAPPPPRPRRAPRTRRR